MRPEFFNYKCPLPDPQSHCESTSSSGFGYTKQITPLWNLHLAMLSNYGHPLPEDAILTKDSKSAMADEVVDIDSDSSLEEIVPEVNTLVKLEENVQNHNANDKEKNTSRTEDRASDSLDELDKKYGKCFVYTNIDVFTLFIVVLLCSKS